MLCVGADRITSYFNGMGSLPGSRKWNLCQFY